ncbi:hypothetical protein Tco_0962090, partial [Tanacetum coccineum]
MLKPRLSHVEPSKGSKSKESKSSSSKGTKPQSKSSGGDLNNTDDQPNVEATSRYDWFKKPERPPTSDSDWNTTKTIDFRPPQTWISKIAKAEKPPLTFYEMISTPIDFLAYVMNNLKIENLTQEHLIGPAFNLLKGTCRSRVELEYHFEECIEDMVPSLYSPVKVAYKYAIWGITHWVLNDNSSKDTQAIGLLEVTAVKPIPPAPTVDSAANVLAKWNAVYDAYNETACLMLGSMTPELHRQFENYPPYEMLKELKSMFEKQARVERFDLIQTFHACKQEEGKPVTAYVLKMKGYLDQLERLGYVLPQDLSVGLILNGLTRDFVGFVINYNMHNTGKTIGELHAMLIEYEKVLSKKAKTPQVMAIRSGKIQKANKKSLKDKGKGKDNGKGKDKQVYIPKPT